VDDSAIAELNRAYRGVTGPTDVLAFPMTEGPFGAAWPSSRALRQAQGFVVSAQPNGPEQGRGTQAEGPDLLGDVVISAETARRQARVRKADVRGELAHLLVHGILHLVGYDHGTAKERRRMWHKQRVILVACGIQASAAARRVRRPRRRAGRCAARPTPSRKGEA
jgi:probable rRNA maturation factor